MKRTTAKNKSKALILGAVFTFYNSFSQIKKQDGFIEATKDFPRSEKNLRKWDAPVVADLDQDGYLDLLINDHGFGVQVCWNNKGKFAKPYDIIMGDLHGISAGDFDQDGNIEVVFSRGGGSGSNARNSKLFRVKGRKFIPLPDFKTPLELMRGRTVKFADLNNDGYLDLLNFAFPDKAKKGVSENYLYKNNKEGVLILENKLPSSKGNGQKSLITDFNDDNVVDIILYGNGNVKAYQGKKDFTFKEVSKHIFPYSINDVTSITEIDYDNDGDFDLFFTRAVDFKKGETFFNKETNTWGFYTKRGAFEFEDLEVGDVLNIQNFQSQWPNNDTYFIGETGYKYEFSGETHSGKDITFVNSNALGFPDSINFKERKGIYIGYVGNRKWRLAGYLWAPGTGIVSGVKKYPETIHSEGLSDFLLENKKGKFKNVTQKTNILHKTHTVGATISDFDNNGFQDILILCRGNLVYNNEAILYLNKGKERFETHKNHYIITKELGAIGMAIETIDYNKDGKQDVVIGNERGKWHLFKNELTTTSTNNYITVEVGTPSSKKATALGAIVELQTCNQKQKKRIGTTGASYSLSFNNQIHFGIGTCEKEATVKVTWSNGEVEERKIKTLNTHILMGNKTNSK